MRPPLAQIIGRRRSGKLLALSTSPGASVLKSPAST
jgi:hypothetical protein